MAPLSPFVRHIWMGSRGINGHGIENRDGDVDCSDSDSDGTHIVLIPQFEYNYTTIQYKDFMKLKVKFSQTYSLAESFLYVQEEQPLKYDLFTKNKATKIENSTNWKHTFAICNTDF